ncbi:MAG TPA: TatD family hydrolase [Candidatus Cloacimonadota bacterium]|nr:TatD family hydrolase [Candidatus Cloacimonadota bacterium]
MSPQTFPTQTLVDGHCHLANLSLLMPLEPLLEEAARKGVARWLSSALTREEIHYYLDHPRPEISFSAGIHPNYEGCDLVLEDIASLCSENRIWAVGEIGLDRNGPPLPEQEKILTRQLELASDHALPVVLHIVGHQQRAYDILRGFKLRYLVHGYAGSLEGFRLLARLDSWFTVSERILRLDKHALLCEMVTHRHCLAETDITRHYVKENEPNPLLRLSDVVERACGLAGISREDFVKVQDESLAALMEHSHG